MKRWNAALSLSIMTFVWSTAVAQDASESARLLSVGPHGGVVHASGDLRFEVVFSSQQVQVFVFDPTMQAVPAKQVRGRLGLSLDRDRRKHRYDLYPLPVDGEVRNGLFSAWNLSQVPDRAATAEIALYGLGPRPVRFSAVFERSRTPEQLAIRRQRICPVSGKSLGSMGKPPRVSIGDQEVYVCCVGCTQVLKAKPEFYLAKLPPKTAR